MVTDAELLEDLASAPTPKNKQVSSSKRARKGLNHSIVTGCIPGSDISGTLSTASLGSSGFPASNLATAEDALPGYSHFSIPR